MATKFLEPGGDSNFLVSTTQGWWGNINGSPAVSTTFLHGNHVKSISCAGGLNGMTTPAGTVQDAGARINFFVYINSISNNTNFMAIRKAASNQYDIRVDGSRTIIVQDNSGNQLASGGTIPLGAWSRIAVSYTITDTTHNTLKIWIDGSLVINLVNATINATATDRVNFGYNGLGSINLDMYFSDFYIDDSSALTDPGNIWVTAKRPVSNGTLNEFTTQIGSGGSGYGSGHSPQVNERAASTSNGWSLTNTTVKTEEYTIEAASVGDINITGATIVDFGGWITAQVNSTSNTPVHHIILVNVLTLKTMTTSAATYTVYAGSTTYPAGNTDIGMDAKYTTTGHLTSLFECGIMIAYIPPPGPANLKSLDTNVASNIKSYNTNPLANIKSIDTNA